MRPCVLFLACLLGVPTGASRAVDPPPMSNPIVLDHGFRYPYRPNWPGGTAIARGDSVVLLAYEDMFGAGAYATLLGPRGEDVGGNLISIPFRGFSFDVADPDSLGWKFAFLEMFGLSGDTLKVGVRNLDRRTLASTNGDRFIGTGPRHDIRCPRIARYGGGQLLGWIDKGVIHLVRLTAGLEAIDPVPITVAENAWWFAVEMTPVGGMLVWVSPDRAAWAQPLGDDALPVGSYVHIHGGDYMTNIDLAPMAGKWLVTTQASDDQQLLLLDAAGQPQVSRSLDLGYGGAVSVGSSDSTGFILFNNGTVRGLRVDSASDQVGSIIQFDQNLPFEGCHECDERRTSCAWTGSAFALMWYPYQGPPTNARGPAHRYPGDAYEWPIYGQWVDEDGTTLLPERLEVSQGALPGACVVSTVGDRTLAVLHDGASDLYLNALTLDPQGRVVGEPSRFSTPAYDARCGWPDCSWSRITSVGLRPWSDGFLCVYRHVDGYMGEYTYDESGNIVVDRLTSSGAFVGRTQFSSYSYPLPTYPPVAGPQFATRAGDAMIVYGVGGQLDRERKRARADLIDATGAKLHHWAVGSDSSVTDVTVAAAPNGYLAVWSQYERRPRPRAAMISPSDPGARILGMPFLAPDWHGTKSRLIEGPTVSLCLFIGGPEYPTAPADGQDLYAVRFDHQGNAIDRPPIPIYLGPNVIDATSGVWDSNHFLTAWRAWDGQNSRIYGCRIGSNGAVVDTTAFVLLGGGWTPDLTSDARGNVTFAYGHWIKLVEDLVPLDLDDGPWIDDPVQTDPIVLRVGRIAPNPARDVVRLDLDLPRWDHARVTVHDLAGRRVFTRDVEGPLAGPTVVWDGRSADGRRAAAGVYFLDFESGDVREVRKVFVLH